MSHLANQQTREGANVPMHAVAVVRVGGEIPPSVLVDPFRCIPASSAPISLGTAHACIGPSETRTALHQRSAVMFPRSLVHVPALALNVHRYVMVGVSVGE